MLQLSLKAICNDSKLSKKLVKAHILAGTLGAEYKNGKYLISEGQYSKWLNNVPDLREWYHNNSIFLIEDPINFDPEPACFISIARKWRRNCWNGKSNKNSFTYIDLFAGAGGLSLGFLMAGYKPIGFVENDNYATKTYVENIHKNENVGDHQIDITNFESKREFICQFATKNVDVILGGFPCKGFSLSGSRVLTDHRNSLYRDMLEIVKEISPKYVVMENVTGILSMYSGLVIDKIISDYNHIGYKISYAILNSANYYVPQNRRRVIMIANKINQPNYFPLPLIKEEENFITTGQCLIKYLELDEDPSINHIFSTHSEEMKNRLSSVPEGGTLFPNYNDSWKKSPWDKPSCTVKENHGATNIHPKLPRVITAREMAALQSFPDDFIFYGSKSSQLRQIGNAVPPLLSKAVALAIEKGLISNIMNK